MTDQCKHCTARGEIETCLSLDCGHHKNWWAVTVLQQLTEAKEEIVMLKAEKRFVCDSRPNLLHLGWAQGNYSNKCRHCETIFTGDKRAGCCADCAWKMESERAEKAEAEWDCKSGSETCSLYQEKGYPCYRHLHHSFEKLEQENKRLLDVSVKLYTQGYMRGHDDTVDGCFTPILPVDEDTYFKEDVEQALKEVE